MAGTGPEVVAEVRRIMRDRAADPVVPEDDIRQAVNRCVSLMAAKLGVGTAWVSPALTLTTLTRDYALPTTDGIEYQSLLELVYTSDRQPLVKVDREIVDACRVGESVSHGRSLVYSVTLSPTQEVEVNLPYLPQSAETVDALVSVVPATWPIGPATAPAIPFSQRALRALELFVAHRVFKSASDDTVVQLDLSPKSADEWFAEAEALQREEALTVIRFKRARGARAWWPAWVAS